MQIHRPLPSFTCEFYGFFTKADRIYLYQLLIQDIISIVQYMVRVQLNLFYFNIFTFYGR